MSERPTKFPVFISEVPKTNIPANMVESPSLHAEHLEGLQSRFNQLKESRPNNPLLKKAQLKLIASKGLGSKLSNIDSGWGGERWETDQLVLKRQNELYKKQYNKYLSEIEHILDEIDRQTKTSEQKKSQGETLPNNDKKTHVLSPAKRVPTVSEYTKIENKNASDLQKQAESLIIPKLDVAKARVRELLFEQLKLNQAERKGLTSGSKEFPQFVERNKHELGIAYEKYYELLVQAEAIGVTNQQLENTPEKYRKIRKIAKVLAVSLAGLNGLAPQPAGQQVDAFSNNAGLRTGGIASVGSNAQLNESVRVSQEPIVAPAPLDVQTYPDGRMAVEDFETSSTQEVSTQSEPVEAEGFPTHPSPDFSVLEDRLAIPPDADQPIVYDATVPPAPIAESSLWWDGNPNTEARTEVEENVEVEPEIETEAVKPEYVGAVGGGEIGVGSGWGVEGGVTTPSVENTIETTQTESQAEVETITPQAEAEMVITPQIDSVETGALLIRVVRGSTVSQAVEQAFDAGLFAPYLTHTFASKAEFMSAYWAFDRMINLHPELVKNILGIDSGRTDRVDAGEIIRINDMLAVIEGRLTVADLLERYHTRVATMSPLATSEEAARLDSNVNGTKEEIVSAPQDARPMAYDTVETVASVAKSPAYVGSERFSFDNMSSDTFQRILNSQSEAVPDVSSSVSSQTTESVPIVQSDVEAIPHLPLIMSLHENNEVQFQHLFTNGTFDNFLPQDSLFRDFTNFNNRFSEVVDEILRVDRRIIAVLTAGPVPTGQWRIDMGPILELMLGRITVPELAQRLGLDLVPANPEPAEMSRSNNEVSNDAVESQVAVSETESVSEEIRAVTEMFITPEATEAYRQNYVSEHGEEAWKQAFENYVRTYLPMHNNEGWLSNWFSVGEGSPAGDIYSHVVESNMTISQFNNLRDGTARELRNYLRDHNIPIADFRALQTMLYEIQRDGHVQISDNMPILGVLNGAFVFRMQSLNVNQE